MDGSQQVGGHQQDGRLKIERQGGVQVVGREGREEPAGTFDQDPIARSLPRSDSLTQEWLIDVATFQVGRERRCQRGGIGPMFGQLGSFHKFAGKDYEDKRPRDRYVAESKRLLGVLDKHLIGRDWIMGSQYTIADIATFPWVRNLVGFYGAGDLVEFGNFSNVKRVLDAFVARPAVARGLELPKRPS